MTVQPLTTSPVNARLSFGGLVKCEWIKLLSLRSTYWVIGVFIVVTVGFSAIMVAAMRSFAGMDEFSDALIDLHLTAVISQSISLFGQLIMGVLGVLIITNEYGSGMIRTSFTAAPTRLPVIAAKTIVLCLTSLMASGVSTVLSYVIGRVALQDIGIDTGLISGENWRVVVGLQLYIMTIALLGFMMGLLIRATAGAIAGFTVLTFVLPLVGNIIEGVVSAGSIMGSITGWRKYLLYFFDLLPTGAGSSVMSHTTEPEPSLLAVPTLSFGPWTGYGILCLWVFLFALPAIWRLQSRDA
jgi:ABC-2 type transport system permease protein